MPKNEGSYFTYPAMGGTFTTVTRVVDATSEGRQKVGVSYSVEGLTPTEGAMVEPWEV